MRGSSAKTLELIRYAHSLLQSDHPQTSPQLHSAIFSRSEISYENTQADYKRLSRATSLARRTYRAWELAIYRIANLPFSNWNSTASPILLNG